MTTLTESRNLTPNDCHRLWQLAAELEARLPRDPREAGFLLEAIRELYIKKAVQSLRHSRNAPRFRVVK
jgi:hypothetical protein